MDVLKNLSISTKSKIILIVLDGLGDLPFPVGGKTPLEKAKTPNLDKLARRSICGLIDPIARGITPGSGPAHLGLFGYNPFDYEIGRGALSAAGVDFAMEKRDVAARINFCNIDEKDVVVDRRAGRIPTEESSKLCKLLSGIGKIEDVEIFVKPEKEHRAVVIFRGEGLSDRVTDSDPQKNGLALLSVDPTTNDEFAKKMSKIANKFVGEAKAILKGKAANCVLLRGFAKYPHLPSYKEVYKLKACAIAAYPMYKGIARLVGMEVVPAGESVADEFKTLQEIFNKDYDFFFIHIKGTDSAGEDGNFKKKVKVLEEFDKLLPIINKLSYEALVLTGDHSTPCVLKAHSWHPVPILINSKWVRIDDLKVFTEASCLKGGLGRFPAIEIMPQVMAAGLKLKKYGA